MNRTAIALVVFLVALGIVAGLYATGPKYKLYCPPGANEIRHIGNVALCQRNGVNVGVEASLRRTNAWERIYYAVVGSKDTRG